jgi:MFS transporter, DHA1 family, inner membrane transport protein
MIEKGAVPRRVLPVLVLAQFAGTSPWFAVNAVMPELQAELGWPDAHLGLLTSALQFGFIVGTLVFALLAIADRFPARRVFLLCALAGGLCTLGAWAQVRDLQALMVWRFATGFFLAGIYPVGMKIASQWYRQGLGAALGLLVGALVLGSASAHGLRAWGHELPWDRLMWAVAALSAGAGLLLHAVLGEPPARPGALAPLRQSDVGAIWTDRRVRSSVLGYFGHMWELYTVWVLVPWVLATRLQGQTLSLAAFVILGAGALGCVLGGLLVQRLGGARVATVQLALSGGCCLLAPWALGAGDGLFYAWLLLWGITVSGDSPQFSALTARNAPPQAVGSVLTLTNSIGFAISIVSILLHVEWVQRASLSQVLPWLAVGPALGLLAMRPLLHEERLARRRGV